MRANRTVDPLEDSLPRSRTHGQLAPNVTGLLGVFDDNPPGGPFEDDSQTRGPEANGVRFSLNTGASSSANCNMR